MEKLAESIVMLLLVISSNVFIVPLCIWGVLHPFFVVVSVMCMIVASGICVGEIFDDKSK